MGRILSKSKRPVDTERLGNSFDIAEDGDQNHIISKRNNNTVQENKDIQLIAHNGTRDRHDEYEEDRRKEAAKMEIIMQELQQLKTDLDKTNKQNRELSEELHKLQRDDKTVTGINAEDQESRLVEQIKLESQQTHKHFSQQIEDKLEDHSNFMNILVENFKTEILEQMSQQQQSMKAIEDVQTLQEMIRILSISTVIKNTAHLNFSPTDAMDTIEIKIEFTRGTEGRAPKMINVKNLMRITNILELKYHLAEKYKHLKVAELAIKWKGIELADAATLLEYGIFNNDKLELEIRAIVTYNINIMIEKDSVLNTEVTPATRIRYLKELIYDKISIPTDRQQLKHGDITLHDDKRMAECQIGEGDTIRLEVSFVGSFPINIICPSGIKHQFEVEAKDSVETVKLQLANKEHIRTNHFDLFYKTTLMENSKKLSEYGIASGETLLLRVRTPLPTPTYHPVPQTY